MTAEEIKILNRKAEQLVDEALHPLLRDDGSDLKEELWPEPETAAVGVRSDGREFSGIRFMTSVPGDAAKPMKYSRIISEITGLWMEKDPTVIEWGEDIANFRKGPYGACDGLVPRFPGRIKNTPISESAFSGMALGAAMNGLKPIVEIMFPDFVLVAADQLFNQIGKARHMYGNTDIDLPLIFRTRIATGTGMGPQHSMDPAALFSLFPGWRIIAPSNGTDYIGLFNTAMVSKDPVLILEHQLLYNRKYPTPENWDYYIPFGEASTIRTGSDITLISYGGMTGKCSEAAATLEKDGISCEILDLRTIDPESIDYERIGRSLKKTGLAVIAEESVTSQSLGFRIGSTITERFWDILKKPPLRITSIDAPVPTCKTIEQEIICDKEDITIQIRQWMA
jgi:2-oxoisovalerate dehydrogenase E1 component